MSRHPYNLPLRWGSGPSAIVLTDIDFVVDVEVQRPSRRDDWEVAVVAVAVDGMQKHADSRWHSAVTGNLRVSNERLFQVLADWAVEVIEADETFCAARIEEAREAASEQPEDRDDAE